MNPYREPCEPPVEIWFEPSGGSGFCVCECDVVFERDTWIYPTNEASITINGVVFTSATMIGRGTRFPARKMT